MTNSYISRAGIKFEEALRHYGVDVTGKVCMDVGAATGGFTDCFLQHGAKEVYAVETGYGVLDWKLRNDLRVIVKERSNILYSLDIPRDIDIAVVDTSWTKLKLSVPATSRFVKPSGIILALIKPQYEVDSDSDRDLRRGVLDSEVSIRIAQKVAAGLQDLGFVVSEIIDSPITGEAGNKEYWIKLMLK
ncbi:TlyA family rRNA (cytidine-2'-O)-methyltransferase [Candidatus Amesbacteria bacterium]|nr:TlyA family rRNA (cytidine-2'-O)-methyltransferase [Candidatus Amesbacteria bacterium]